jgi:aryl-alcohol dehydrogenase-like predicted oxidoreductase
LEIEIFFRFMEASIFRRSNFLKRAYNAGMTKFQFGKTGFDVSVLGFGSAPIGYLNAEQEKATALLNLMLDSGVNVIDTAASYPGSEEMIGRAIGHRRDQFVVISKCGGKLPDLTERMWTPELISKTVDRSLKNLGIEQLDVMLLHSCDLKILQDGKVIEPLVKARDAGKIKFLGYSGDNEAAAYAAGLDDIAVIETSINIADQINIEKVLPICRAKNVGVLAKRPIGNACWKDLSTQQGLYKTYAKTYTERLAKMKVTPADLGFAPGDWPEIALRFTLSQPGVHSAIIGTQNIENAKANLAIAEKGPLPADVAAKIREAFIAADNDGRWTGQT